MLEGKVLKDFNDIENNLKKYTAGKDTFKAEDKRYKELFKEGYVDKAKEVKTKKDTK